MPQRVRTTSSLSRRAVLRLEWLEDRRVPSLLGLLSGAVPPVPLLSAPAPAAPAAPAAGPVEGLLSGLSAGAGVGLQAAVGVTAGGVKLNLAAGAPVGEGGALLSTNLAAGASVTPSAALTLNAGAGPGAAQPTQAEPSLPVAVGLVPQVAAGGEVGGVAVPTPSLPGPLPALPVAAVVKPGPAPPPRSDAPVAPAGVTPAAGQLVTSPSLPVAAPGTPAAPLTPGPAVLGGLAAVPPPAAASNLLPTVPGLLTVTAPLPARDDGGAEAAPHETASGGAVPPLTSVVSGRQASAAAARFESGTDEVEEDGAPAPAGSGPATDLLPDGLSAEAAEAVPGRAGLEVGDGPGDWRWAPWVAGLAAALAGAELERRRRRAAAGAAPAGALPVGGPLWGLPGLWPGQDG
jgi:hypothetical protein